jgi:phosphoribosylformimino-5-aminoimidazole carboxamide ribotide isomerase
MIIPCIDLMGGTVVQLVQGRDTALSGFTPDEMLEKFDAFPEIQVIDLDAAMGKGSNDEMIAHICQHARARVGGGVRTVERAHAVIEQGAIKVIIGTAAFTPDGINARFLEDVCSAVGQERVVVALDSKDGRIVVKGWRESLDVTAESVVRELEPFCSGYLCTYVDKEGMMQGTDLEWFRRLRAATKHEITAAGGISTYDEIRALQAIDVHAALGMAIYTGRLDLETLAEL